MRKMVVGISLLLLTTSLLAQNVGIGVINPTDRLHINAATGTDALRVQVNSATKFRVNSNGGTSIGTLTVAPANGLIVQGSIQPQNGIETNSKLVIESTGDSIIMNAGGNQVILSANGNITIKAPLGKILLEAAGDLELKGANIKINAISNLQLTGLGLNISGTVVTMVGNGQINMNSPLIRMNNGVRGVARMNDACAGGMGGGLIVSASNTVFID